MLKDSLKGPAISGENEYTHPSAVVNSTGVAEYTELAGAGVSEGVIGVDPPTDGEVD